MDTVEPLSEGLDRGAELKILKHIFALVNHYMQGI